MIAAKNERASYKPNVWLTLFVFLTAFIASALAVGWFARARLALDRPNERSLHAAPVPRTGGIGLLLGVAAGWAIVTPDLKWAFWCALTLLITVSFLDDYLPQGLSILVRLGAHLIAAGLLVTSLPALGDNTLRTLVAALAVCWMCNLYNFMDGSDGLAGGMTFFGFASYAAAAGFSGNASFALLNLAVAAAAAGFLLHNFHPARIFLGDAGSIPLGFLAAVFGLTGSLQDVWPWWFPLLVFSPFVVDATVTLVRRACARTAIWRAHRDHYYQRLVQLGWGHRRTALAEYALMLACGLGGLAALKASLLGQAALLVIAAFTYAAIICAITLAWRRAQAVRE